MAERYPFKPFPGSSHSWALDQARGLATTSRVLDIGAGTGLIGEALKALGFEQLTAVEIDEFGRAACAAIYRSVEGSIEPLLNQRFDLILLLDVLEHLAEPEIFFRRVAGLLAPGGTVLISVPNIAHWSLRLMLLAGWFEPAAEGAFARGPLDRTHLQCFTRRRLRRMLDAEPALVVSETSASIVPLELILPRWARDNPLFKISAQLRLSGAKTFPGLLAYQLLAAARARH